MSVLTKGEQFLAWIHAKDVEIERLNCLLAIATEGRQTEYCPDVTRLSETISMAYSPDRKQKQMLRDSGDGRWLFCPWCGKQIPPTDDLITEKIQQADD